MTDQELIDIIDDFIDNIKGLDKFTEDELRDANAVIDTEYRDLYAITAEGDFETRKGINEVDRQYVEVIDNSNSLQEEVIAGVIIGILMYKGRDKDIREVNRVLSHMMEVNDISVNEIIEKYKRTRKARLRNIPKIALQNGLSLTKIIKELRKAKRTDKNSLDAVMKTVAMASYNERLMVEMKDEGVEKVIYTAVLDNRTTQFCKDHDGKIYDIDSAVYLPAHYRCRSSYLPVPKDKSAKNYKEVVKRYKT